MAVSSTSSDVSSTSSDIKLLVIGMPASGKSSFMNVLASDPITGRRGPFAVGAGRSSVTKKLRTESFDVEMPDGSTMVLTLTDTMGFPDPDPDESKKFYNTVLEECNKPLNAIVWVAKANRDDFLIFERAKVLLRELNGAQPPIFLIINGYEDYDDDGCRPAGAPDPVAQKAMDLVAHFDYGSKLADAAGIGVAQVIAGAEKRDLRDICKPRLLVHLLGTTPKASNIRTLKMIEEEMQSCTTDCDKIRHEERKIKEKHEKRKRDAEDLRNNIRELESKIITQKSNISHFEASIEKAKKDRTAMGIGAAVAGAASAALAAIPVVGPIAVLIGGGTAAGLAAAASDLSKTIKDWGKHTDHMKNELAAFEKSAAELKKLTGTAEAAIKSALDALDATEKAREKVETKRRDLVRTFEEMMAHFPPKAGGDLSAKRPRTS